MKVSSGGSGLRQRPPLPPGWCDAAPEVKILRPGETAVMGHYGLNFVEDCGLDEGAKCSLKCCVVCCGYSVSEADVVLGAWLIDQGNYRSALPRVGSLTSGP